MTNSHAFNLVEQLVCKKASMDKIIDSIQDYRPFNAEDAIQSMPYSGLIGSGIGALLGGASGVAHNMTKGEDEEEADMSKRLLTGALTGGGLGVGASLLGPSIREPALDMEDAYIRHHMTKDIPSRAKLNHWMTNKIMDGRRTFMAEQAKQTSVADMMDRFQKLQQESQGPGNIEG